MRPIESGLRFPEEEKVPETKRHLEIRTALYQALQLAFGATAAIGSEQFVYWDPTDPRQCLSPDLFVRVGFPDYLFRTWKVWENGAPQIAVEVISPSDERDRDWDAKLVRYRRLGVMELVRFDPESSERTLRVWDSCEGDLVERQPAEQVASNWLSGYWVVVIDPVLGPTIRLSRDASGRNLYPTPAEASLVAEQRIRELEAELSRRDHL
jgi:Putative restriction endonuclease